MVEILTDFRLLKMHGYSFQSYKTNPAGDLHLNSSLLTPHSSLSITGGLLWAFFQPAAWASTWVPPM